MPRKTDGILFELQPRPTKGDDGKPLLYAQPVIERKYDLGDIDDFCAKYRHTSRGEMKRLFDLLSEVTTAWLRQGYITISTFMYYSHLKRKSAKSYLDSLCEGEKPRLHRYREGRTWHYAVVPTATSVEK